MGLSAGVEAFVDWLVAEYGADGRYERVEIVAGADLRAGGTAVRAPVANRSFYEVRVPEAQDQVQVGFGTESRVVNESIEQMILDNGEDLSQLLGDELCDLGCDPIPMEHFFERPAFRYTCRLPVSEARDLLDDGFRSRVKAILKASHALFQPCVDEA